MSDNKRAIASNRIKRISSDIRDMDSRQRRVAIARLVRNPEAVEDVNLFLDARAASQRPLCSKAVRLKVYHALTRDEYLLPEWVYILDPWEKLVAQIKKTDGEKDE